MLSVRFRCQNCSLRLWIVWFKCVSSFARIQITCPHTEHLIYKGSFTLKIGRIFSAKKLSLIENCGTASSSVGHAGAWMWNSHLRCISRVKRFLNSCWFHKLQFSVVVKTFCWMLPPVGFTALKETSCLYDAGSFDSTEAFYILGIKRDNWLVKKPSLQKMISCTEYAIL